jgi:hypothetical protein
MQKRRGNEDPWTLQNFEESSGAGGSIEGEGEANPEVGKGFTVQC